MQDEMKSSISKLRSLRDDLCRKQSKWKEAFNIKDEIDDAIKNVISDISD